MKFTTDSGGKMVSLIKIPVVSAYYLIYAMFDRWVNWVVIAGWIFVAIIGIQLAKQDKKIGEKWKLSLFSFLLVLYLGITGMVFIHGGFVPGKYETILHVIYLIGTFLCIVQMSNKKWLEFANPKTNFAETEIITFYKRVKNIICVIFGVGLVPMIAISPYIFPRADDYSFGYRAHLAFEQTGSLIEVVKAAFEMIKTAYFGWQGTYSSIFLMAIQPAVFDEKLYRIVPMFFITIIVCATWFFVKTILVDWLQANKVLVYTGLSAYLLMVIQCIPVKQSAFLWYNGAIHYIASHCMLLCMLTFMVKVHIRKSEKLSWVLAALCAVYVGGGNHVTAVSTLLLSLTFFAAMILTKKWKEYQKIGRVWIIYLLALAVNVVAPGNFNKMDMVTGSGLIESFFRAFITVLEYMLGKWMHWTVIVVILFCLPIIWRIVREMNINFSYPVLFVGYSWCYMASMFFTPLYTLSTVEVGRFQNIMFLQGMLWLLFDIGYVMGWMQRKCLVNKPVSFCADEKKYVVVLGSAVLVMTLLSVIAEPEKYTSVYALNTLRDEQLQEYAADYWHNIEILEKDGKEATIKNLDNIPSFLHPEESEAWHSGLRFFYNKDKIYFEEE